MSLEQWTATPEATNVLLRRIGGHTFLLKRDVKWYCLMLYLSPLSGAQSKALKEFVKNHMMGAHHFKLAKTDLTVFFPDSFFEAADPFSLALSDYLEESHLMPDQAATDRAIYYAGIEEETLALKNTSPKNKDNAKKAKAEKKHKKTAKEEAEAQKQEEPKVPEEPSADDTAEKENEANVVPEEPKVPEEMPAADTAEKEAEVQQEQNEPEAVQKETAQTPDSTGEKASEAEAKPSLFARMDRDGLLVPLLLIVSGLLYVLLSCLFIYSAALVGYLLGWILTEYYLKKNASSAKIYAGGLSLSLLTLVVASLFSILVGFLIQSERYNFWMYLRSLSVWQGTLFNIGLGMILSLYGIYSTVPSKKARDESAKGYQDFK